MRTHLMVFGVVLAACAGKKAGPQPGQPTKVGAAGGSVVSDDGAATLTVPAGALAAETTITVKKLASPKVGTLAVAAGYELLPSGTTFSKPATLTLSGDHYFHDGAFSLPLLLLETAGEYELVKTDADVDLASRNVVLSASIPHFSSVFSIDTESSIDLKLVEATITQTLPASVEVGTPFNTILSVARHFTSDEALDLTLDSDGGQHVSVSPATATASLPTGGVSALTTSWTCAAAGEHHVSQRLVIHDSGVGLSAAVIAASGMNLNVDPWDNYSQLDRTITYKLEGILSCTGTGGTTGSTTGSTSGGVAIDPSTANVVGLFTGSINRIGTTLTSGTAGAELWSKDASNTTNRTAMRDELIGKRKGTPGQCVVLPFSSALTVARNNITQAPVLTPQNGAPALVMEAFSGTAYASLSANHAGASYAGVLASETGFAGASGPVLLPNLVSGLQAGTLVTNDNKSELGESQTGHRLGGDHGAFEADTATLPSFSWETLFPTPSSMSVRIISHSADPTRAITNEVRCYLSPTATSFTVPQDVFDDLGLNNPLSDVDITIMSLWATNLSVLPAGDDAVLVVNDTIEDEIYFRKVAPTP